MHEQKNCTDFSFRGADNFQIIERGRCLLRVLVLTLALCGVELDAAPDPYTSEFEKSPQPDFFQRDRRTAQERQEHYRKRVPVHDAVGPDVPLQSSLTSRSEAASNAQPPAAKPELYRENLFIAATLLLLGAMTIRKFGPEIADYFSAHFNPWVLTPSSTASFTTEVRAEDEVFAEFLKTFQAGPLGAAGATASGLVPATLGEPLKEFFAKSPQVLGEVRRQFEEIGHAPSSAAQREMLTALHRTLRVLKGEAGLSELLPVWQMTAALEGLVNQLIDRAGNITPSTLRTLSGGISLLKGLCLPGLRADLLSNPPIRLLAVDDDLISRSAVARALKKALNPPDLADNGEAALALATQHAYDAIFLDVQMPRMDGFELCTKIHELASNKTTPVVFVTCHSDFEARAQSTLSGGSDLIGKPFLTFEITVKALTLVLQGRLLRGAEFTPRREDCAVVSPSNIGPTENDSPQEIADAANVTSPEIPADDQYRGEWVAGSSGELSPLELTRAFLTRASVQLQPLRDLIQVIFRTTNESARREMLADFYLRFSTLTPKADSKQGHPALRLSSALEGLFKKLLEHPEHCTSSTLLTVATALDLLTDLCAPGVNADLAVNPSIRILVADDDPISRRLVAAALQTTFKKPASADGGEAALALAMDHAYDVIFLDVQMPGMDGFTACLRIHETVYNRNTPIVFVTGQSDFQARSQSTVSGGSDLIGKPFLTAEITLKALTLALRGRLQKLEGMQGTTQLPDELNGHESSSTDRRPQCLSLPDQANRRTRRRNRRRNRRAYQSA